MAKSFNSVTLVGRLVRDPEVKKTKSGKDIAGIVLAVDRQNDGTDFFEVDLWDKLAELAGQYLKKGAKVLVSGRLAQQTWEQDGKKRSKVTVTARDLVFLDGKSETAKADTVAPVTGDEPINLDDIPF